MSHATFERALATLSIGGGTQRAILSIYDLADGTGCYGVDERADLESLLRRLELSFHKTGGVPHTLELNASRPFTKPKSRDWSVTFRRFCTHFGLHPLQADGGQKTTRLTERIEFLQARPYETIQACEQALDKHFPPRNTTEKLRPLPASAFVCESALFRRVAGDGFIVCRGDAYSVPDEYRGKTVWIQICDNQATVLSKEGRLLAQHTAGSGKGGVFIHESHFARRQPCVSSALQRAFLLRFPQFTTFLSGLLAQRGHDATATLRVVLELASRHPPAELTRAIEYALRYNNFSHRFMRGYLTGRSASPSAQIAYEQGSLFDPH
jgi:hypothetical protein